MASLSLQDRVKIWNSFFFLARRDAKALFELRHSCKAVDHPFRPLGGMLGEEERGVLGTLAFCALAVEARANHLIEKLVEERKLTRKEGDAAMYLPPERKWFLLPRLAGRRRSLRADVDPHRAISKICSLRNDIVHVRFDRLSSRLPSSDLILELFTQLVDAMEDLNDVLGDSRGRRKRVQKMAQFTCS